MLVPVGMGGAGRRVVVKEDIREITVWAQLSLHHLKPCI